MGSLTLIFGIKFWVIWDAITNEANILIINLNLTNPIPAYIMATLDHGFIRPGQMVMTTGSQYIIDYIVSILPTVTDSYDFLTFLLTGTSSYLVSLSSSIFGGNNLLFNIGFY